MTGYEWYGDLVNSTSGTEQAQTKKRFWTQESVDYLIHMGWYTENTLPADVVVVATDAEAHEEARKQAGIKRLSEMTDKEYWRYVEAWQQEMKAESYENMGYDLWD